MSGPQARDGGALPLSGHTLVLGRERAMELAAEAIRSALAAGADEAEVVLMTEDSGLTRYAANQIHQHVAERNIEVRVRAAVGSRVAVAVGNQPTADAARKLGERAAAMATRSPEDPYFCGLPAPSDAQYLDQNTFYTSTAELEPADRAATVLEIVNLLRGAGAQGFGAVTSAASELTVVNSHGLRAYQAFTDAWVSVVAQRERVTPRGAAALQALTTADRLGGAPELLPPAVRPASGFATSCHRDWTEVDAEAATLRALAKASLEPPRHVPPGRYTVILEEEAVAEMLGFLAYGALNGLEYLEGKSPFAGRLGERAYPSWITLRDDPTDARGANVSMDFEGAPKAPLTLIREGTLEQVAWDSTTARRLGIKTTGHALPAPNPHGPMPLNLVLSPGTHTKSELVAQVERGLLITRFHYVNEVDPAKTLLTGMTRDGTFLIENGHVTAPVQDLRWVESIEGVLTRTRAIGDAVRLISEGPGYGIRFLTGSLMPALLVDDFEITGSAE
jgi:predicted Zn-dependent protease